MKHLILSILLLSSFSLLGQMRFEVGGHATLVTQWAIHDYVSFGLVGSAEKLVNEKNAVGLSVGYERYISTHGYKWPKVFSAKFGYRRFITQNAPKGMFYQLQAGLLHFDRGNYASWVENNDGVSPTIGLNLGWINGNKLYPTIGYSVSIFPLNDYWNRSYRNDYVHHSLMYRLTYMF